MNAESRIRKLVQTYLADNHKVDGVGFVEEILLLTLEVGEVKCALTSDRMLRFQLPNQPTWEVMVERAKSKLRLVCARLAVLCNESHREVSPYGGEGVIEKAMPAACRVGANVLTADKNERAESLEDSRDWLLYPSSGWIVCFKNTPSEQEFSIRIH